MRRLPTSSPPIGALLLAAMRAVLLPCLATATEEQAWPREIETDTARVIVYQPQLDKLEGDNLSARAAVMVDPAGDDEPIFGAFWLEARIETDLDTRIVELEDIRVPRVRFANVSEENQKELADLLIREMPTWDLTLSMDRMSALLDLAERQTGAAEGFNNDAPDILFRDEPSVLVTIDGEPQLREMSNGEIQSVVNSPFLIVENPKKAGGYFLYGGSGTWYSAPAVKGPWTVTKKVPKKIKKLEPEDERVPEDEAAEGPGVPPAIVVVTRPSELIVTEGEPEYEPVSEGELLIVSNTESDVLREVDNQRVWVLLSGRWFSAPSFDGPWKFSASDALPTSFAAIDPDSDYGYLLAWVAGTHLAEETLLDSSIPQTAAIKRTATIQVSYEGEPRFEPIEETSLSYAVNTESQVIRAGEQYFCADEGAWYVAEKATGPWRVADKVPEEIRAIPPSSPVYNTKYVYIYDSTPEVVYVGYYPGYTSSYYYRGALVYGTGWYYSPWWGPRHYYPRHSTWGFSVRYNPWYGWSFGLSYSTGPFTFSFGYGGWHHGGWWGPGGYRGYRAGYHRGWHQGYRSGARAGYRAGYRASNRPTTRNLYQRPSNASNVARTTGVGAAGAAAVGAASAGARSPAVATGQANNVFTDKAGNVYREQGGQWQQRDSGQWKDKAGGAPSRDSLPQTRPSSGSYQGSGSMSRDSYARSRGNQRSYSAPQSRPSGGRGGMSRGGGRRPDSLGFL